MDGNFLGTTVVGSYPQPDWLIDREALSHVVPRVRQASLWRVSDEFLEAAQDDATLLAIAEMERAEISIERWLGDNYINARVSSKVEEPALADD